ncbi:hypothetical protein E2C01_083540 [Portunus trituberculatus]|uniref:Uncharacterized protein n=1 Tax=Portunus trituberculatus TaxID=210409 RepID=A0A5B7J8A8_PORTR|nr:hypothetical protein [Portunus trituberculatus]
MPYAAPRLHGQGDRERGTARLATFSEGRAKLAGPVSPQCLSSFHLNSNSEYITTAATAIQALVTLNLGEPGELHRGGEVLRECGCGV